MRKLLVFISISLGLSVLLFGLTAFAAVRDSNPCHVVYESYYDEDQAIVIFPGDNDWDWGDIEGIEVLANKEYVFLMIDGVLIPDAEVVMKNSRTLVPVRIISEKLGGIVGWDNATRQVTVEKGGSLIVMTIDSEVVSVNGVNKTLDVPATLINSRTYVPLRFIAENMGVEVGYYSKTPFIFYPVVWVDNSDNTNQTLLPREECLKKVKEEYLDALDRLVSNPKTYVEELYLDDEYYEFIVESINNKEYLGEFSRFWIFGGQVDYGDGDIEIYATDLVDKYTGTLFCIEYLGESTDYGLKPFYGAYTIYYNYFTG